MDAGMPTPNTPSTTFRRKPNFLGLMHTKVLPRRIYRSTIKYRQATQLEIQVAMPAPPAPMSSPQGRMKMGSSTMFSRQPLMVPTLACRAAPSARTR